MQLQTLLAQPLPLPSTPKAVALLLSALERPEVDLKEINQCLGTDPALTTRLLQLANSAPLGMARRIHSVSEALALLHLQQVRSLAQEAASSASLKAIPGIALPAFWQYSLNVATVSRALARLLRAPPQTAFTCGLVHAIGELAMHLAMPGPMAQLNAQCSPLDWQRAQREQAQWGYDYGDVTAGLARRWELPLLMVQALEHFNRPFENGVYEPLCAILHLAVWRARAKEAQLSAHALADTFPGDVGLALGLDMDRVLQQDPFDWMTHR